jgi:hypothetical protein
LNSRGLRLRTKDVKEFLFLDPFAVNECIGNEQGRVFELSSISSSFLITANINPLKRLPSCDTPLRFLHCQ